jgi:hypothetical protein
MNITNIFTTSLGKDFDSLKMGELITNYFSKQKLEFLGYDYYLSNESKGIECVFSEKKILRAIQLFNGVKDDYNKFDGNLPLNLKFSDSMESANLKIDIEPFQEGASEELAFIGKTNPWRKYQLNDYFLRLEFDDNNSIALITISSE